jgi:hypothetical protein
VRGIDASKPDSDNPQVTSLRIILFAQLMAVIASITGFIGLTIAYKALIRDQSRSRVRTVEPPTIG